ncbi:MAG: hypothetical protein V1726_06990 [Methanobacteriota archaeon]
MNTMESNNLSLQQKATTDDIININYWKEVHKEINSLLKQLRGIILLTHNSIEFTDLIDVLKKIKPEHMQTILYISLVRSYDFMRMALNQKQLNNKKIFFIDCVSGYAFPEEINIDNCLYHKPPNNLEQMKQLITFGIEKAGPDIIVIDSLSQFINFTKPTEHELSDLYKFIHELKENALNIMQDTFILLYDTKLGIMQHLPKLSFNLILKIEIIKEMPRWKD